MAERHYPRAPITEALIDLQVAFTSPPEYSDFVRYGESLVATYPSASPINFLQVKFEDRDGKKDEPAVDSGMTKVGVRLTSTSADRILQLQRRGFTFSHMPPYSRWASFAAEARVQWEQFVATFHPIAVTRAAVRYINRIVIPSASADMQQYFRMYPQVPGGVPQTVTGCFMQLVMPQSDISDSASAVINFALEPQSEPDTLSFLLDFDVFSACELTPSGDEVWDTLAQLRNRKNELFEASITDAARGLFK
ncbi:TIGR04255 family protein [Burkholderia sp. SCN-KJ]|uniref:TIGR04255 family protein n=1 Tax=Burkholderia sp. SCN-KJ TaxID=2969248 RepID=UPI00214FD035|nr:TIGR04255 family protein [Burkholderia sp. SCN-KJ]MCR4471070.1 TIGR04255 family protein [Burkholderia sp. SCN-KJ]